MKVHEKEKGKIKMNKTDVINMISNTEPQRDKLVLYLLAIGFRVAEVMKLKPRNIVDNTISLNVKMGKVNVIKYVYTELTDNLIEFIQKEKIGKDEYIFPISYYVVNNIVRKAGHSIGKDLNSYNLRCWVRETQLNSLKPIDRPVQGDPQIYFSY